MAYSPGRITQLGAHGCTRRLYGVGITLPKPPFVGISEPRDITVIYVEPRLRDIRVEPRIREIKVL